MSMVKKGKKKVGEEDVGRKTLYPCAKCSQEVDGKGVFCVKCDKWWHYKCDNTTARQAKAQFPPGKDYICTEHRKREEEKDSEEDSGEDSEEDEEEYVEKVKRKKKTKKIVNEDVCSDEEVEEEEEDVDTLSILRRKLEEKAEEISQLKKEQIEGCL